MCSFCWLRHFPRKFLLNAMGIWYYFSYSHYSPVTPRNVRGQLYKRYIIFFIDHHHPNWRIGAPGDPSQQPQDACWGKGPHVNLLIHTGFYFFRQVSEDIGAPMVGLSMYVYICPFTHATRNSPVYNLFSDANLKGGRLASRGWWTKGNGSELLCMLGSKLITVFVFT